jgi:hypothetical protein
MRAICARDGRERRARRGHYVLRDLAGFANIERLLATETPQPLEVTRSVPAGYSGGNSRQVSPTEFKNSHTSTPVTSGEKVGGGS